MLPGTDLPLPCTPVDVVVDGPADDRAADAGRAGLGARVEQARKGELVLALDPCVAAAAVRPGARVEVFWLGAEEVRVVPAELVMAWSAKGALRWRLCTRGPAAHGQRRDAVRAPLRWRVTLVCTETGAVWSGRSLDISECGMRLRLEGGTPPAAGTRVALGLTLRGAVFPLEGEVARLEQQTEGLPVVGVHFLDVAESMADMVRSHVFAGLREQRRLELS